MSYNLCNNCGANLKKMDDSHYACEFCHAIYPTEKIENYADKITKLFDESKLEAIANARKNLYKALSEDFISADAVHECCIALKQYLPDDFQANFYDAVAKTTPKNVARLIRNIDVDEHFECLEMVIKILISSLHENFAADTSELITRTFEKKDILKYNKYMTMLSVENEKLDNCVYLTNYPRDVFIACSHKDMEKVLELLEVLEEQDLKCFLWTRNLQHGAGSHERYRESLQEAMDNCKCFVFVSSMNSRNRACDAFIEEMPYIKQQDINNAPSDDRYYYSRISKIHKKPRVEYFLEASSKENAADDSVKEFFDGYERAYTPMDVAQKVIKQIAEKPIKVEKKKKYCISCLNECDADDVSCNYCGSESFSNDLKDAIEKKRNEDKRKATIIAIENERREREEQERRQREEEERHQREEEERRQREAEERNRREEERRKQEEFEKIQRETLERMQEVIEKLQRNEEQRRQEVIEKFQRNEEQRRQEVIEKFQRNEEQHRQEKQEIPQPTEEKENQQESEDVSFELAPEEQYQLGENYYQSQDFDKAFDCYFAAANKGHDKAQYKLGILYAKGNGARKNFDEAVKWFELSANQENANARYNLGVCYEYGYGVEQNYSEAIRFYTLSANQDNPNAQYNLGFCYERGKGVAEDPFEAFKWYKSAARQGLAKAQNKVGVCYYYGKGTELNPAEAVRWYKRAAEQGDAMAQYNLGHCYEYSCGVTQNYDEALKWYKKAAEQGYDKAIEAYENLKNKI